MAVDYTVTFNKDGKFENGDYVLTAEDLDDLTEYILRVFGDRFDGCFVQVPCKVANVFYYGAIWNEHNSIGYTLYLGNGDFDYAVDTFTICVSQRRPNDA